MEDQGEASQGASSMDVSQQETQGQATQTTPSEWPGNVTSAAQAHGADPPYTHAGWR